jgi:hypothetical protein
MFKRIPPHILVIGAIAAVALAAGGEPMVITISHPVKVGVVCAALWLMLRTPAGLRLLGPVPRTRRTSAPTKRRKGVSR